jgi:ribosomal protein S1
MRRIVFRLLPVLLLTSALWVHAAESASPVVGTVTETGWGKFKVAEDQGVTKLLYQSKKVSAYKPYDWRPVVGDRVSVECMTVQKRNGTILQVTTATLKKAGPSTVQIKSPVEVIITETGRSGYKVQIKASRKKLKFTRHRGTVVSPVGWVPVAGDKALITYTAKSSRMRFGLTYQVEKIEKRD